MTDHSGQFFGRYYLKEQLGEGGMAVVYRAHDTRLDRDVAIKVIRTGAFPSDDLDAMLKRFEREAKSLAKLSHPNIVKIYDFGEHEGSPYLVMEYLPGGTLKNLIGKPIPWRESIRFILPVARGVAYAHKHGILHRDIKPANVLITDEGDPMLSDFGIVKLFEGEPTTELTRAGVAIGTPGYMAPEQWEGITSPQSDLYSLGIILYEMVAGRKPYIADTPAGIIKKQAIEPLPSPRKFVSDLSEDLDFILLKVLAKEPSERYRDLHAFIDALEKLLVGVPNTPLPAGEQILLDETYKTPVPEAETVAASPTELSPQPVAEPIPVAEVAAVEEEDNLAEKQAPTKIASIPVGSPIPLAAGGKIEEENKQLAYPTSSLRTSIKFSRKWTGIFIGGAAVILAIWLGLPLIEKLGFPTLTPIATSPLTSPPVVGPEILETIQPTEIQDDKGVEMVLVSEGEFTMGSDDGASDEQPPHTVFLNSYYIDKYEVTNAQYKACVDTGPCDLPTNTEKYDDPQYAEHPVVYVDWNMAKEYCEWQGARLPTEAEWEKAARGTDGRTYPWGEGIDCTYANYSGKSGDNYCVGDTVTVGSYESGRSPSGAYDMAGNVWEWIADWYDESYYSNSPETNPTGPDSGDYRVLRGGAWNYFDSYLRSALRLRYDPSYSNLNLGFRCSRSP